MSYAALAMIAASAAAIGVGRADMHPDAFEAQAVQAAGLGGAVEQRRQRERALAARRRRTPA